MKVTHVRRKVMLSALAGAIMIPGSAIRAKAADGKTDSTSLVPVAGIESVLTECLETNVKDNIDLYLIPTNEGEYLNRAFSNVKNYSYIRNAPNEESEWTGKLYDDSTVTVLEYRGDWTKIRSGSVEGYVPADALYTGDEAKKRAKDYETNVVTVLADVLNVRSGQGTENEILTQVMFKQQYEAAGEPVNGWYPVKVDGFDGWVCGEYVEAETTFSYAESKQEEQHRLAQGDTQTRGTIRTAGTSDGERTRKNKTAETRNKTDGIQTGTAVGSQANGSRTDTVAGSQANGAQTGASSGAQANGTQAVAEIQTNGTQTVAASGNQSNGTQANGTQINGAQTGTTSGSQSNEAQANGTQTVAASGNQSNVVQANGTQTGAASGSQSNEAQANGTQTGAASGSQSNGAQANGAQAGSISVDSMGRPQFDGAQTAEQGAAGTGNPAGENTQQADGTAEVQETAVVDSQEYAGQAVIDFACQFIGNPYVWGGTSLTNGADCSGFVQSVYANFGIALPRTTYEMVNAGYEVSYDQALPGDLVLYDGHVGLYMGDGTIVNAMNEAQGIGICTATYAPIITVRRVL